MIDNIFLTIGILIIVLVLLSVLIPVKQKSIVDQEPEMDWTEYNNGCQCPHYTKVDVVTDYTCTCETVETWCLNCTTKLSERFDC